MTEHTDTRRLQIPTSNMTAADLVAFADDVREAVDGSTPVKVTHRAGIFTPPETILVEIPTADSCDLPEIIDRDDEHPDLDPDVPVVDQTRCVSTVTPVLTHGKTGQILTRRAQLDQLPAGSIVVPTWLGDRTDAGLNTCTKFSDKWLRAIDDPAGPGVYPLGALGTNGRPTPDDADPENQPVDGNPLGVLVVYDPRDQL